MFIVLWIVNMRQRPDRIHCANLLNGCKKRLLNSFTFFETRTEKTNVTCMPMWRNQFTKTLVILRLSTPFITLSTGVPWRADGRGGECPISDQEGSGDRSFLPSQCTTDNTAVDCKTQETLGRGERSCDSSEGCAVQGSFSCSLPR